MGSGWSWSRKAGTRRRPRRRRPPRAGRRSSAGWPRETHRLYVLDEFTYPINWGWVDIDDVVEHPGRPARTSSTWSSPAGAPTRELLEIADLVTEMTKIKHPFDDGPEGPAGHRVVTRPARGW